MPQRLRDLLSSSPRDEPTSREPAPAPELVPLRMVAAPMLLLTGVEATLDSLSRGARGASHAAVWAPSLLAPMAAAAQIAHLSRPSKAVSAASRVLNTAVVGAGVASLAGMLAGRGRGLPSLAPLALTAAGLLGLLLDRQEARIDAERERLERRARIVERLVPRRRARLDRVVVHA
jgi:hypothetical protein